MDVLCLDFLNSEWRDWKGGGRVEDKLQQVEWWEAFLQRWGLSAPLPSDAHTLTQLTRLRDRMRSMVERLTAGERLTQTDLDVINQALGRVSASPRLVLAEDGYRLEDVPSAQGWPLVMARIAGSFAELLVSGDVRRIKICANDDCRWVFYDESRNRSRRWCDDKLCGNLMKVRRFRARQKANE